MGTSVSLSLTQLFLPSYITQEEPPETRSLLLRPRAGGDRQRFARPMDPCWIKSCRSTCVSAAQVSGGQHQRLAFARVPSSPIVVTMQATRVAEVTPPWDTIANVACVHSDANIYSGRTHFYPSSLGHARIRSKQKPGEEGSE